MSRNCEYKLQLLDPSLDQSNQPPRLKNHSSTAVRIILEMTTPANAFWIGQAGNSAHIHSQQTGIFPFVRSLLLVPDPGGTPSGYHVSNLDLRPDVQVGKVITDHEHDLGQMLNLWGIPSDHTPISSSSEGMGPVRIVIIRFGL